ncbi:MAG: cytochrome c family protein [Pseudolabrys sp.]
MNSFELNKIMGAVLGACLVLLALNIAADAIFSPEKPAKPGYAIAVQDDHGGGKADAKKEPEQPIEVLLASASAEKGVAAFKPCQACHTVEKGGPNRVGPNLWGIVGRKVASHAGFNYSAAMKAKAGDWSYEALNKYLANPRADVPGTNMSFAGVSRDGQRADLIAYLRTLADAPLPLPTAKK